VNRLERKKLEIPATVSNRVVTNRGVHLQPFGYHGFWLDREVQDAHWTELLKKMGISWVVMITEGDSVLEERHGTTPLKTLLDAGIIPIIRDKQIFPRGFENIETVRRAVDLCADYGMRPFWQLYNEPFDPREWKDRKRPDYDEAWHIIAGCWSQGARQVVEAGAYVGFPDGPCYRENPFERLRPAGGLAPFEEGMAFYAPHNYGLGRPLWYPYDAVTRHAAPLSEEAYRRLLDDYAEDPRWHDAPVALINEQRRDWVDPDRTAVSDDTCWRGWEKIVLWSLESLGFVPPMAMTEGGWTPRARAGVESVDNRWSYATPRMVAKKTLHMYDTPSPFFAICPWLLATDDMGGTGWPDDAWHGGSFTDKYERAKPVIATLIQTPPKEVQARPKPLVLDVDGDTRNWGWVKEAYGAQYERGSSNLRLIEVHEYEGPATLDVLVVDGDGLPVEGVPFYHRYPGAPLIGEGEWFKRAELRSTGPDGRISFPAEGDPAAPGKGREAVWPQGKGDVLRRLGLLAGTRNRHLNGVWQLLDDGAPPVEDGGDGSESEDGPGTGDGTGGGNGDESGGDSGEESPGGWAMVVEYRPGPRIIAGSFPRKEIKVTIADPWGNASTVDSGSKPEHGPGGFEVLAPNLATYTLTFLDQTFEVPTKDGVTFVTFSEGEPPGDGSGDGTEPGSGEGSEPGTGGGTDPGTGPETGTTPGGGPVANKLGFYLQVTTGIPGLAEAIRTVKPPTLLTHANDRGLLQAIRRELSPDTFVVGRLHLDVHDQNVWLAGDGERAARGEWLGCDAARHSGRTFAEKILDHDMGMATERYPNEPGGRLLIDAWMSLNECLPGPASEDWLNGTEENRQKLRAKATAFDCFQAGFRKRLQEEGLEAVALNFGAGNFQRAEHYVDWFPRTLASYTYLGFHEYGWPTLYPDEARGTQSAAHLYHKCMVGIQAAHPGRKYRVIITEAGLARMYHSEKKAAGDVGWLYEGETISEGDYWRSLRWYNDQLRKDDYVLGACLFNVGPTQQWWTFRHLGTDNEGRPLGIMERIGRLEAPSAFAQAIPLPVVTVEGRVLSSGQPVAGAEVRLLASLDILGADPKASVYDPTAITWTRSVTGFAGSQWNGWQRFVASEVAGLTWEEFKVEAAQYNPSLRRAGARFEADQVYLLPEPKAYYEGHGIAPQVVWDRQVTGFAGDRWTCWRRYVQTKVAGLTWQSFRTGVVAHNPHLAGDGNRFVARKSYLLPRNAGQDDYTRVEVSDARGRFHFSALPSGRYIVEVRAPGHRLYRQALGIHADVTLTLALKAVPLAAVFAAGPFVGVDGRQFTVLGRRFRFVGVNLRALAHYGTGQFDIANRRDQLKHAHEMGVRVVRLFLAHKDASPEEVRIRLACVLDLLRAEFPGMYLIPAFTDLYINSEMHPQGDDGYYKTHTGPGGTWTTLGEPWFVDGYTQNYLPLVKHIVGQDAFRNEPRILAWEIGNELKVDGKPRLFVRFNHAVADVIRSLDPGHLITTGMMSTAHAGLKKERWRELYEHQNLNFVTCHIYNANYRDDDSEVSQIVGKPFVVEEAGFDAEHGDNRVDRVRQDMETMIDQRGAAGYLQWGFMAGADNRDGDRKSGMDWVHHSDWNDLFGVYRQHADRFRIE